MQEYHAAEHQQLRADLLVHREDVEQPDDVDEQREDHAHATRLVQPLDLEAVEVEEREAEDHEHQADDVQQVPDRTKVLAEAFDKADLIRVPKHLHAQKQ